jgi:hypothetical protein
MATKRPRAVSPRAVEGENNPLALTRSAEADEPWAAIEKDPRAFVDAQLPAARRILEELRAVIRTGAPRATEEVKWHVLFFSHAGMLCFLDPGRESVKLGFMRGADLAREHGDLLGGTGRFVRALRVKHGETIPTKRLVGLVRHAVRLNEASASPKKRDATPTRRTATPKTPPTRRTATPKTPPTRRTATPKTRRAATQAKRRT